MSEVDSPFSIDCARVTIVNQDQHFPLLIERASASADSRSPSELFIKIWTDYKAWFEDELLKYGTLWFRGFDIGTQSVFQTVTGELSRHNTPKAS